MDSSKLQKDLDTISQLTNLCKTLAAAILLTSSTHFGARLGAFFY